MKYERKTADAVELSAACSRAALSRRNNRGGRRRLPENELPLRTLRISARDYAVLKSCAAARKSTLKQTVHMLARLLVHGGSSQAHAEYAPSYWFD